VFDYLKRAYPAEPQPVRRIDEAVTYLVGLGFSFVWTGSDWGLECRSCMTVYIRSGHAGNHRCSSGPLVATSSERAKQSPDALEGSSVPDRMSWDLSEAELGFEHVKDASGGQDPSELDLPSEDIDRRIKELAQQREAGCG
jgi:hypothetical protein